MIRTRFALVGLVAGLVVTGALSRFAHADGFVTFGTQGWDQSASEAKYQEFKEIPRGAYLEAFAWREWRGRNFVAFYGDNALRADQRLSGTWMSGARLRVDIDYVQTPHNFSYVSRSVFTEVTPGVEVVSDTLQAKNQASASTYVATMKDALSVSPFVPLGFRTDVMRTRVRARPARGWQFELVGSSRNRSGKKPYGGSFGFNNTIEVWEPVSQRMSEGNARIGYEKDRLSVQAIGGVSIFENNVDALVWDNPARLTGLDRGRTDLYPDNNDVHGSLALGYQLPKRTALNATVGVSQVKQDDAWMPYTINSTLSPSFTDSLPIGNTEGKVNVLSQDYRLTSHPIAHVGGTLRFRDYQYQNETPEHLFAGHVAYDNSWSADSTLASEPFSFRKQTYGADVDWTPISKVGLGATAERTNRDRLHREVTADHENAFGARVRVRPRPGLEAKASYRRGERRRDGLDLESYENAAGTAFIEQPGLRRFDVAERDQDLADAGVSWMPTERFDLGATFHYQFNDYTSNAADTLGLRTERQRGASVTGTVRPHSRVELSATYGWNEILSDQLSRQSGSASLGTADSTWRANIRQEGSFASALVDWNAMPDRLGVTAIFEYSHTPGTYDLANVINTAQDLPPTGYLRQAVAFEARYDIMAKTQIGVRWAWEQYDADDFASQDIPLITTSAAGAQTAIYLGDNVQSYRANLVALVLQRRF